MNLIAIDPGTEISAIIIFHQNEIVYVGIDDNYDILERLKKLFQYSETRYEIAIEMIASYGMSVGQTTFETCVWIGRFIQAYDDGDWEFVYRKEVCMHLCGSARAKDSNIRQALIDMYGGTKQIAVGTKKAQGKLYGFKSHLWAALGVAETYREKKRLERITGV